MQAEKFTPETRIRLLLTLINDEGFIKYETGFSKLIVRLNEYFESNLNDIIDYLCKVIMYIPLKQRIYANVLQKIGKTSLTNEVFTRLIKELKSTNDPFIISRCISFFIESTIYKVISPISLKSFTNDLTVDKDNSLLWIIIRALLISYDKTDKTGILMEIFEVINKKYENSKRNEKKLWDMIYLAILKNDDESPFNNIPHLKIEAPNDVMEEDDLVNPFKELIQINFLNLVNPEDFTDSESEEFDSFSLENYIYKLLLLEVISALKDNFQICEKYLYNINTFYGLDSESEIQSNIENKIPEVFMLFALRGTNQQSEITIYASLCVYLIKNHSSLEDLFTKQMVNIISNNKTIDSFSPYQIMNFISFLTFYASNVPNSKNVLFKVKIDPLISNNAYYLVRCLCDKMSNLLTKSGFEQITKQYDNITNEISTEPKPLNNNPSPDFEIMSENIKLKQKYSEFKDKLSNSENTNDLLYNFSTCILINRGKTLSHLREAFSFYKETLREMEEENKDEREYILLNAIFDVWGHSSIHLIFIIELLYNKYLLGHLNVIKFIFSEKLNQSKEHILNWVYYEIIELTINNSRHLVTKAKVDLNEQQQNLAKSDEDASQSIIRQIEFFEGVQERLTKEKETLFDEILNKFNQLYQAGDRLGGNELKSFLLKMINDFIERCFTIRLISSEKYKKEKEEIRHKEEQS